MISDTDISPIVTRTCDLRQTSHLKAFFVVRCSKKKLLSLFCSVQPRSEHVLASQKASAPHLNREGGQREIAGGKAADVWLLYLVVGDSLPLSGQDPHFCIHPM